MASWLGILYNAAQVGIGLLNNVLNPRSDLLVGYDGPDLLRGREGSDVLQGGAGEDVLKGGKGADLLMGGEGRDKLFGGAGKDHFLFAIDTLGTAANADRIMDFGKGKDVIVLGIHGQPLRPAEDGQFHVGSEATTPDQQIIYDRQSGWLHFDRDGSGDAAQVRFAKVKPGTDLHADDFLVALAL